MSATPSSDHVMVVGAGVVGIACAHYLSQSGLRVTVIDQGKLAGACSRANCGYVSPCHVLPLTEPEAIRTVLKSFLNPDAPFRVKPTLRPAMWHWMWQFARRCTHSRMMAAAGSLQTILDSSIEEYRRLMATQSIACEWQENGLLYVMQSERGMQKFAQRDALLSEHFGLAARRIEGAELPAFDAALKPGLAGAYYYPEDASLRPDLLNARWIERIQENGVTFVEDCALLGVQKQYGKVTLLKTSTGEMRADHYVFATGAWSARLSAELECRIPVEPGKGYSVTMDRPSVCPALPMLFPEHKVGVSPFETGYRLGSMMEFAGFDTRIPARRIQQLRDSAVPYLVEPYTDTVQEEWYGWRPMTWDSLPIIGRVPRLENALLATGHNMLGVTLAAATGRLIAEMVNGQPTHIDATPFSPGRF